MVPMAPVVVLALSALADEKSLKYILGGALASCFLFGLNLEDPLRGSYKSSVAYSFRVNGNPVVLDPLQGLLTADRTKKIQRTTYATSVYAKASTIKKPSVVIAGWWLADLLVMERENVVTGVEWRYYVDEAELWQYIARGCTVYYLPEQNTFNDVRFKSVFTNQYAVAF